MSKNSDLLRAREAAEAAIRGVSNSPPPPWEMLSANRPKFMPRGYSWLPDVIAIIADRGGDQAINEFRRDVYDGKIIATVLHRSGRRRKEQPEYFGNDDAWTIALKGHSQYSGDDGGWLLVEEAAIVADEEPDETKRQSERDIDHTAPPTTKKSGQSRFSMAAVRKWYLNYVEQHKHDDPPPSRSADMDAIRDADEFRGGAPTRDAMREVRNEIAPNTWTAHGRRKETGKETGKN